MMEALRLEGHTITHDWTHEDENKYRLGTPEWAEYMRSCAAADVDGVTSADAVVLLRHPDATGALVEMGIAIGCDVPVVVVNPERGRYNIFHELANVFLVDSPDEVKDILERLDPLSEVG